MSKQIPDMPLLDYANEDRRKANSTSVRPHNGRQECEHCHAPTMEYRHTLSRLLGEMLLQLYRFKGQRARLRDLHLPNSKFANFQKLQYWGLVDREKRDGKYTAYWYLTYAGEQFARVTRRCPKQVWTYRGRWVEFEGQAVLITDLVRDYNTRVSYAQEARPHERI